MIPTLEEVIKAVEISFPGVEFAEIVFQHIGSTPYDLILRKKHPVTFQEVSGGFQKRVCAPITLALVIEEVRALPNFEKYGFAKTKVFWEKWELCLNIGE